MAEVIEYILRVKGLGGDDDEGGGGKKEESALTTGLEGLQKKMHPIRNALKHVKDESSNVYFLKEIGSNVMQATSDVVDISVNRYFRMSEDYKGQNYLNNVKRNIGRAKSFSNSILMGAIGGSKVAGAPGAIVGVAISGVSSLTSQIIQYQNSIASFKQSLNATRVQTAFQAERAGLYDGGRGTEN